jgi:N-carbamoylsarcosine amidase
MSDRNLGVDSAFQRDLKTYKERTFMRRMGFGKRPALIIVDLANAWTKPGGKFACDDMETIIPSVAKLLEAARRIPIPVVYTSTAYQVVNGPFTDMGVGHLKKPLEALKVGSPDVEIDDRIKPLPSEQVIIKKRNSAFFGTYLGAFLRASEVDTVLVTGVTMAGCIRHTVEDALSEGLRPMVVREGVGDRVKGPLEWNLFDIEAKFGDVVSLDDTLAYLGKVKAWR